jgi:hypothetical protein
VSVTAPRRGDLDGQQVAGRFVNDETVAVFTSF